MKPTFYHFHTELGMISAEVTPTLEALGDQPWAVRTLLDAKKCINKSFSIQ